MRAAPFTDDRAPASAIAALADRTALVVPDHDRPTDGDPLAAAEGFLRMEARMLDERRLEAWLDLWAPDGLLWVPLDPQRDESPVDHQSLVLDDRLRLRERVERLRSRSGWSQVPPTRTVRHLGNVEAWPDGAALEVRSVLTLHTHRSGETAQLAGRQEHRLVRDDGGRLRIVVKVIDLLGVDGPLPNTSHLF